MSTSAKVAAEKKVDLPTFGLPTIPIRTRPPEDVKAVTRYQSAAYFRGLLFLVFACIGAGGGIVDAHYHNIQFGQVDFTVSGEVDRLHQ